MVDLVASYLRAGRKVKGRAESASDTILRIDIEELKSTGLSIMPEGLEKSIDVQAMADIIAYLMQP